MDFSWQRENHFWQMRILLTPLPQHSCNHHMYGNIGEGGFFNVDVICTVTLLVTCLFFLTLGSRVRKMCNETFTLCLHAQNIPIDPLGSVPRDSPNYHQLAIDHSLG